MPTRKSTRATRDSLEFEIPEHPLVEELGNPRVREIQRIIGGERKEAEQIATLEGGYPASTLPELVTMNYLNSLRVSYVPQAWVLGGRSRKGGQVPDFLVQNGGSWNAWLVQGSWYHNSEFQRRYMQEGRDMAARLALKGSTYEGFPIQEVVTLEEEDIYNKRPLVFELAMAGQELA